MGLLARMICGAPRAAEAIDGLVVDLERLTVAGLGHRDHRTLIEQRLGPPQNLRRARALDYSHLGISVELDAQQRLVAWSLWTPGEDDPPSAGGYRGGWRPGGSGAPSEREVLGVLGEPAEREVDDEEVMLAWHKGVRYVGIDFALGGALSWISVDYAGDDG